MLEDKDLRSVQEVRTKIASAHEASRRYRSYSQEQVDQIIDRVAAVARANSESLARLAVEETGYGNAHDKTLKNLLNSDILHRAIRPLKTVGIIREDRESGILEIAEPVGVVAAILPTTNPTSTAFFKTLIALKGRNSIVLSPHPRATRCTCEAARLLAEAAVAAGAPEGVVECLGEATIQGTNELMRHRLTGMILSTGGTGIVRAAYSSGKPALGVGPGNVAVLLEASADVDSAIGSIVDGKSFDYGTVCSSEQCVIAEEASRAAVMAALAKHGGHVCDQPQTEALAKLLITPDFRVNADCVGQSPQKIAEMAGFHVAPEVRALVVELHGVGRDHPLSAEKLSPVLSVYFVKDFAAALKESAAILNFGGRGHTCVIYSKDDARIREFALAMPAFRVLVNTPAPQGSTGITTNVFPSMTLGCGAMAGNITSDNVGPMHLINIKRVAYHVRDADSAFESEEARSFLAGRPAAATTGAGGSDIAVKVDRYLAQRGVGGPVRLSSPAPVSQAATAVLAKPSATVVDRFLSSRPGAASFTPATGNAASSVRANPGANPAPPAPLVDVVPFVCEDDVRRAMVKQSKIYVGKKTIITPAARDLDYELKVLVPTE